MKKILTFILLGLFLAGLTAPILVNAAQEQKAIDCCRLYKNITDINGTIVTKGTIVGETVGTCVVGTVAAINVRSDWGGLCIMSSIYRITDWIFYLIFGISILFVALGAFSFAVSSGEPEKVTKAKKLIVYALIGMVVAAFARVIPSIIKLAIY